MGPQRLFGLVLSDRSIASQMGRRSLLISANLQALVAEAPVPNLDA